MNKNKIDKAIKELLSKDKKFAKQNVQVNFDSKEIETIISKGINSLKTIIEKNIG